jgi:hypothetical protein
MPCRRKLPGGQQLDIAEYELRSKLDGFSHCRSEAFHALGARESVFMNGRAMISFDTNHEASLDRLGMIGAGGMDKAGTVEQFLAKNGHTKPPTQCACVVEIP